jgi:Ca2+-binding RTX toxin-like protein
MPGDSVALFSSGDGGTVRRIWLGAVLSFATLMVMPAVPAHAQATCDGRAATIIGTGGNDQIVGTGSADVIVAGAGDDFVQALGGNDIVCLGAGNDYIWAGEGADRVDGGIGDDLVIGGPGNDVINGAEGNDTLHADGAYDGTDTFNGSTGFDAIDYSSRSVGLTIRLSDSGSDPANEDIIGTDVERITGSQVDDTLIVTTTAGNTVEGGSGDDTIDASDGVPGNDKIAGNYGIDQCRADAGDTIHSCP